jgi:hypothetical protein
VGPNIAVMHPSLDHFMGFTTSTDLIIKGLNKLLREYQIWGSKRILLLGKVIEGEREHEKQDIE